MNGNNDNKYSIPALKISVAKEDKELIINDMMDVLNSPILWTNSNFVAKTEQNQVPKLKFDRINA